MRRRNVRFFSFESLEQEHLFTVAAPMCSQCWRYYRRGAVVYKGHYLIGPRWDPALCAWCGEEATGLNTVGDIAPDGQNLVWQLSACQRHLSGMDDFLPEERTMPTGETTEAQSTKSYSRAEYTYQTEKCQTCLGMQHIYRKYDGLRVSCPACQRG